MITGIDIGGTHITICMLEPESAKLFEETMTRHSVDPSLSAAEIIEGWAIAVKDCWQKAGIAQAKIGIAMPGPFDYENGISYITGLAKYETLYQLPVKQMLADALEVELSDIRMVNDATAYVRGECGMGGAVGCDHVLGITLGTGLGSALYVRGQLVDGDLYKFPFKTSTAEEYGSTRWFLQAYEKHTGHRLKGVKELAELAGTDAIAKELFEEFGDNLGAIIQTRYQPTIPDTIVIGGNIARSWALFTPAMQARLGKAHELKLATLGEKAALIGAAYLWV